ncbi:hypothetical protein A3A36_02930 [Candidatus Kaiserbacteria bacterium RIFCSPLOWO2_01_FULL_52_12b]|uniref:Uncharacterized protein n=1 Tax=Candidatus Kaiserbacteria bacterium RIFCSPLOWO2_01_FULL_52_12b TaxID=1798509 RepID=A0A1F6EXD7_9BACT|nr:MAG: hypothetical protein A3A36_02930 [Candidatus Kaiserbacteria bacterium RIFCSPLOWO2_01_FULL_52_12b]
MFQRRKCRITAILPMAFLNCISGLPIQDGNIILDVRMTMTKTAMQWSEALGSGAINRVLLGQM